MRRNPGFVNLVQRRIYEFKETVKTDTLELRIKWINKLDTLFEIAAEVVKPGPDIDPKGDPMTEKEKQMWAHVAAHVGLVMGNLAKGYDETRFNEDLTRLERQINEIKRIQAESKQAGFTGNQSIQTAANENYSRNDDL